MTERTFRKAIAYWGYRLRRKGKLYALIDAKTNVHIADGLTLPEVADRIADLQGFPAID